MSSGGSYLDLDAILMEHESLPVTFRVAVADKGYLMNESGHHHHAPPPQGNIDTSNRGAASDGGGGGRRSYPGGKDIPAGTRMNVPLWLAEPLFAEGLVDMQAPRIFGQHVMRALRAAPCRVDLHSMSPFFYLLAERLISMADDPRRAALLTDSIADTFKARLKAVIEHTHTTLEESTSDFVQGLDSSEREILRLGQESTLQQRNWARRGNRTIGAASSLSLINTIAGHGEFRMG